MQKKYIDLIPNKSNKETVLEVSVGYDLGGYNYWNNTINKRGYYLFCTPCELREITVPKGIPYTTVTQIMGKGLKILLKEVTRQSKKAAAEADRLVEKQIEHLIQKTCVLYGLELRYNHLHRCKDFEHLRSNLTLEDLDGLELFLSEYLDNTNLNAYEAKYPNGHPEVVCWYEGMLTTNELLDIYIN